MWPQRELGIDVRLVSAQVLADIDPNARLAEDEVAAFEAEAGYVEAVQVSPPLRRPLAARGRPSPGRRGEGGRHRGRAASPAWTPTRGVTTAGPSCWRRAVEHSAAHRKLTLPVQACRTQVALYRRPPDCGRRGAIYGDFVQGIYFKPAPGEVGASRHSLGGGTAAAGRSRTYDEAADAAWLPVSASV